MPVNATCCREGCDQRGELHLHWREKYTGGTFCSWSHMQEWLAEQKPEEQLRVPWWPRLAEIEP